MRDFAAYKENYLENIRRSYRVKKNVQRVQARIRRAELRSEVYEAYGCKCACCYEDNPKLMTIDHIFDDGNVERARGEFTYNKLREAGFPKDRYQMLCWNCNEGRRLNGGTCPHREGTMYYGLNDLMASQGCSI